MRAGTDVRLRAGPSRLSRGGLPRLRRLRAGIVLAFPFALAAASAAETRLADLEYARPAGVPLTLDAFIPAGPGPHPTAVVIHGGGWVSGDKRENVPRMFEALERAGYASLSINYRLAPAHPFPACIEDTEAALRWVRAHAAAHRLDPARLALIGPSAGGHLVSLLGTRAAPDLRVRAVVSFFGVHDLTAYEQSNPSLLHRLFGTDTITEAHRALLRAASPSRHVRAGLPPYLLIHGTVDALVPYAQSVDFQAQLRAAGNTCDLITMPNRGHGLPKAGHPDAPYAAMIAWLDRNVKN